MVGDPFKDPHRADSAPPSPTPIPGDGPESPTGIPPEATSTSLGHDQLMPPDPQHFLSLSPSLALDSPRDSVLTGDAEEAAAAPLTAADVSLSGSKMVGDFDPEEKEMSALPAGVGSRRHSARKRLYWISGFVGLIVAAAIAIPLGVVFGRKSENGNSNSGGGTDKNGPTTGGDGSTVTTEDGDTFVYTNKFGGSWVNDPSDPFNNNAQPNSWTPPLNTSWKWGVDKIAGTNLGGLFVLEPFIVPALFQKYQNGSNTVIDEWTLSLAMAQDTSAGGGITQLEDHYNTFIVEQDIAQIAGAGLNWIRLPIPYWAIDKWDTESAPEPFLARTCWKYILRVFRWARKYGLRINLDLHTAPGSQNGYNHSGKSGQINFLNGPMGFANAQRLLDYIRVITEFISQPEYEDLIPMFSVINEPLTGIIGMDNIGHFYLRVHDMIREITGFGEGNGPFISIHDGFQSFSDWVNFLPGADRVALDTHPYFAFGGAAQDLDPIEAWPQRACLSWGLTMNQSQIQFGVSHAGEFSNGINDCGLYLNGVAGTSSYPGGCDFWNDYTQWNDTLKTGLKQFALASMDALQNYFFWTWKIGNSSETNSVQAPLWSYQLGLENGFMPDDPRSATGMCASLSATGSQFDGTFSAWQTGGADAGTISSDVRSKYTAWPPTTMSGVTGDISLLPTYTPTGPVSTLPPDTFTAAAKTVTVGDGWADDQDTTSGATEVSGCTYLPAWSALGAILPTSACTGIATARMAREVLVTPPPSIK